MQYGICGVSKRVAWLLALLMLFSDFGCQSLQKDKMGEAYSEIGKKGEVSGTCHPKAGEMVLRTFHPIQNMCPIQPLLSVHSHA